MQTGRTKEGHHFVSVGDRGWGGPGVHPVNRFFPGILDFLFPQQFPRVLVQAMNEPQATFPVRGGEKQLPARLNDR